MCDALVHAGLECDASVCDAYDCNALEFIAVQCDTSERN